MYAIIAGAVCCCCCLVVLVAVFVVRRRRNDFPESSSEDPDDGVGLESVLSPSGTQSLAETNYQPVSVSGAGSQGSPGSPDSDTSPGNYAKVSQMSSLASAPRSSSPQGGEGNYFPVTRLNAPPPVEEDNYGKIPRDIQEVGSNYGQLDKLLRHTFTSADLTGRLKWAISADDLMWGPELGRGAFGVVYDGLLRNDKRCAIKVMSEMTKENRIEFEKEAAVMRKLKPHRNLIALLGVCDEPVFALVTEFADNGALDEYLKHSGDSMPDAQIMEIIKGIAHGVEHLHKSGIVHRDLAARNILLSYDFTAKVADFGQARMDTDDNRTKSETGPLKWLAPECVLENVYSPKSDAWAWAVTLVEIYTCDVPFPEMTAMAAATKLAAGTLKGHPIPDEVPALVESLMVSCFAYDPQDRPDFGKITKVLEGMDEDETLVYEDGLEQFMEEARAGKHG